MTAKPQLSRLLLKNTRVWRAAVNAPDAVTGGLRRPQWVDDRLLGITVTALGLVGAPRPASPERGPVPVVGTMAPG